jgi:hypothetical protein
MMPREYFTSMVMGSGDLHLMGKILDLATPEAMAGVGFTEKELARATGLFEDLDRHLNRTLGVHWDEQEVA